MTDVKLEILREEGIGVITLDIPKTRNAMGQNTLPELNAALTQLCEDYDVRCAIITGAGEKAFSSGGDLNNELNFSEDPINLEKFNRMGGNFLKLILSCRLPVIAAVNGVAYGAAVGIISCCDFALAAKNARVGFPTSSLGGIPGWGCTQVIPRAIGLRNAKRLLMGNQVFSAEEAAAVGLYDQLYEQEELMPAAIDLAKRLACYAPETIAMLKKIMNQGMDGSLETGFQLEAVAFQHINQQENFREGISAFMEKRPAKFKY